MSASYRDDLAAAEERLRHLDAAHAEREDQRRCERRRALGIVRDSILEKGPTPRRDRYPFAILGWGIIAAMAAGTSQHARARLWALSATFIVVNAVWAWSFLRRRRFYRQRQRALARVDAELAALSQPPVIRVAPETLDEVFAQIAEREAEMAYEEANEPSANPRASVAR